MPQSFHNFQIYSILSYITQTNLLKVMKNTLTFDIKLTGIPNFSSIQASSHCDQHIDFIW